MRLILRRCCRDTHTHIHMSPNVKLSLKLTASIKPDWFFLHPNQAVLYTIILKLFGVVDGCRAALGRPDGRDGELRLHRCQERVAVSSNARSIARDEGLRGIDAVDIDSRHLARAALDHKGLPLAGGLKPVVQGDLHGTTNELFAEILVSLGSEDHPLSSYAPSRLLTVRYSIFVPRLSWSCMMHDTCLLSCADLVICMLPFPRHSSVYKGKGGTRETLGFDLSGSPLARCVR